MSAWGSGNPRDLRPFLASSEPLFGRHGQLTLSRCYPRREHERVDRAQFVAERSDYLGHHRANLMGDEVGLPHREPRGPLNEFATNSASWPALSSLRAS